MTKNNIWRITVKDKDGKVVETAPGMTTMTLRGPGNLPDLIASANLLLYNKRLDVVRIGLPDPGYVLDTASVEPLGHTDQTNADVGQWAPTNAVPVVLPTDPAVREAHMKLIAERLGVPPAYELDSDGNMIQQSARAPEPTPLPTKSKRPSEAPATPIP